MHRESFFFFFFCIENLENRARAHKLPDLLDNGAIRSQAYEKNWNLRTHIGKYWLRMFILPLSFTSSNFVVDDVTDEVDNEYIYLYL